MPCLFYESFVSILYILESLQSQEFGGKIGGIYKKRVGFLAEWINRAVSRCVVDILAAVCYN